MGVLVGGEHEQMTAKPGRHEIFIKKRKGFIKLALEYGVPIVPAYAFGETDLYYRSKYSRRSLIATDYFTIPSRPSRRSGRSVASLFSAMDYC
jgi:hypothetical protein